MLIANYSTKRLDAMIDSIEPTTSDKQPVPWYRTKPKLFHGKPIDKIDTPAIDRFLKT